MRSAERAPRLRGEARDEAIRAGIDPLTAGERPTAIVVAAALCTLLGITNVILWAAGAAVTNRPPAGLVLGFAAITFAAAWGLWNVRYGAVLGFQAVLAGTLIIASLSVMLAGNLLAVVLCAVVILLGGTLFWKLVRVLARMQAPGQEPPQPSA